MKYETVYNRYLRKAREASKGLAGLERAHAIRDYFKSVGHPHAQYTYEKVAMEGATDHAFAIQLMKEMASLCAENDMADYNEAHH